MFVGVRVLVRLWMMIMSMFLIWYERFIVC